MAILDVKNVNKRFGGLKALDEVNLEVEEGTVHAIIGPNGAGKSTLLNCFVGRLMPDTGTVISTVVSCWASSHTRSTRLASVACFRRLRFSAT